MLVPPVQAPDTGQLTEPSLSETNDISLPTSPVNVIDIPEPLSSPTPRDQINPGVQDQLAGGEGVSRRDKKRKKEMSSCRKN